MGRGRLEAFSDGVIAVIITIMVLELKVPHGGDLSALRPIAPLFLVYVLSFVNIGIYWNNHHHMLHATKQISGGVMWANLHWLFWLSLVPFTTAWIGENHFEATPTAIYGVVLLMVGVAYLVLQQCIIAEEGHDSMLARAIGHDRKGKASAVLYVVSIPLAFINTWIADALFVAVALMWLVPDRRIEKAVVK